MFRRTEYAHPDHNYWFSYKTITTLVQKYGFGIEGLYGYAARHPSTRACLTGENLPLKWIKCIAVSFLSKFLLKRNPFFGDGIILLLRKKVQ